MSVAEVIPLWPDGAAGNPADYPAEVEYDAPQGLAFGTRFLRNTGEPTLHVIAPAKGAGNGVGVVVAPGGGWTILAWEHEGIRVGEWLADNGITAFVLKYRVQPSHMEQEDFERFMVLFDGIHDHELPTAERPTAMGDKISTEGYLWSRAAAAEDGRRAIALARELAPTYGVRSEAIGMMGFSAGGFLTVDVALDPRAEQVAFIAPIYGGETQGATVPADAPPMFTAVAHDDALRRIVEGLYLDWSAADRRAELHVFASGNHGFGLTKQGTPSAGWTELFLSWLDAIGVTKS